MTYHKEGPACGKIPCDPTSSEADCEYPFDFIMEEGRMICSFQKDWTDLEMKFLLL